MKKQLCLLYVCLALLLSACAGSTANNEPAGGSRSALESTAEDPPEVQDVPDPLSDGEIIEIAKALFDRGNSVFWWYHSDFPTDLGIDPDADALDGMYLAVGEFQTEAEMKAATEGVFTNRFCEKILYPWGTGFGQDENGNAHYKEIDGVLYYNTQMGGMGWSKALTGEVSVKSIEPGKIVVTAMADERMLGVDESEVLPYDFILIKENGVWKLDNWYDYHHIQQRARDFQKYLDPVLRAGILNASWEEPSELDPDLFVIFATYRNLEEAVSWFDVEGKYEITPEKDMLVPAEQVEAYILPCFAIQPEQVRVSRLFVAEKEAYIIGGVGGASSAVSYKVNLSTDGYGILFYRRYQDAARVSEGSLRIVAGDNGCSYLSNSSYAYPQAPREPVDDLISSVGYDPHRGELVFTIPGQIPDGYKLYLHIAATLELEDGQMPFHAFEEESGAHTWEPGKTYAQAVEARSVKQWMVTAGLVAENDPTRVLNEIEMYLDNRGNRSFASEPQPR